MKYLFNLFIFIVLILSTTSSSGKIIYIDNEVSSGSGDGTKESPYNLVDAIENHSYENAHMRLDTGTYLINNSIQLPYDGIILEGGFMSGNAWNKNSDVELTRIYRNNSNIEGSGNFQFIAALNIVNRYFFHISM